MRGPRNQLAELVPSTNGANMLMSGLLFICTLTNHIYYMRNILILLTLGVIATLSNCTCKGRVNPNEWVVSTATCWNTMTISKAGDVIPRLLTACDRMIVLPATELAADFTTETKFQNRGSIPSCATILVNSCR
jgi:hypothetical protein